MSHTNVTRETSVAKRQELNFKTVEFQNVTCEVSTGKR